MAGITLDEALLTLTGDGPILDIAREVSNILRESGIEGGVIGGIAVSLHGHVRTTLDVDVFVAVPSEQLAGLLRQRGFVFEADKAQFVKNGVPVHLVTISQTGGTPQHYDDINGIRTVSLADLIEMKLRSGTRDILRAQDLADVIGLIRHHNLRSDFAARIDKTLRDEFRKLAKAVGDQRLP